MARAPVEALQPLVERMQGLLPDIVEMHAAARGLECGAATLDGESVSGDLARIIAACAALQRMATSPCEELPGMHEPGGEPWPTVRHELRTPINVIKGYSEMLLEDAEDGVNAQLGPGLSRLVKLSERLLLGIDELFSERIPTPKAAPVAAVWPEQAGTLAGQSTGVTGRILAVDDTPENLAVLARRLERLGHRVETTTSGLTALELLAQQSFDLVLLDLMMPEISGFDVLRRIKSDPHMADLPVVMISALNETAAVVHCIDAGAEDYLPKPFDPTLLRARVGACLEKKRLRDLERAYSARLEIQAEILARELDAARRMQQSILPVRYPQCPNGAGSKRCGQEQCERFSTCPGIRLGASMIPAKEVGGDFYDFFWLDNHRLGFAVADVSGKGVPAALFMSLSLALLRTIAPTSNGPADCLARINRQLCIDNEMSMFVTMFYGIYDASSGILRYANAGHASPIQCCVDDRATALPRVKGVALGITDDFDFGESSLEIPPGTTLCIYSDGVTEAINLRNEEFGEERLREILLATRGTSVDSILAKVLGAVEGFAAGMPQADDITCLILRRANSRRRDTLKMVLANQLPEIRRLADAVEEFFGRHASAGKLSYPLNLALDEILTNIISYGFAPGVRSEIEVDLFLDDNKLVARVLDRGRPFNPLLETSADLESGVEERQIGGLGIHFAKRLMDEIDYWRQSDKNCLLLVKRFKKITNMED